MKKIISILLSLVMLLSVSTVMSVTAKATDYRDKTVNSSLLKTGDQFCMGMYPSGEIVQYYNPTLLSELKKINCTMKSYDYKMSTQPKNHTYSTVNMFYADIVYGGKVYRKVALNQYRPSATIYTNATESNSYQNSSGYPSGKIYYFGWNPISWRVLAKEADGVYVIAENVIDSQEFNTFNEKVKWENCSLRQFLNETFYNSAFSDAEKSKIVKVTHKNDDSEDGFQKGGNDTTDSVWIPSLNDVKNTNYGFGVAGSDVKVLVQNTYYSRCMGLKCTDHYDYPRYYATSYWLRTPSNSVANAAYRVTKDDKTNEDQLNYTTSIGVRPVMKIKLNTIVGTSDSAVCTVLGHDFSNNAEYCKRGCGVKNTNYVDTTPISSLDISGGKKVNETQVDNFITSLPNDNDPAGTKFSFMLGRQKKVAKNAISLTWKKPANVSYFVVYGNKCGAANKYKRLGKVTANNVTIKGLAKNTYYKYLIAAFDKSGNLLGTTNTIHVATLGGKNGNAKAVTTKAKKNKVSIKKGKSFKLGAKQTAANKKQKIKKHRAIRYECSNTAVATVSAKGVIKGKKKGSCVVYVYAQNGAYKTIKVNVK